MKPFRMGAGRRRISLIAALMTAGLVGGAGRSETLIEALAQVHATNPTLDAARAALRVADEEVPRALAGRDATVNVTGTASGSLTQGLSGKPTDQESLEIAVNLSQPLWTGGRVDAAAAVARAAVRVQRAQLVSTEQNLLLETATAYLNILRDEALAELTRTNVGVLRQQLEATRARFGVGEVTQTDVSLAQSRLAQAEANRIRAEGNLNAARAAYRRLVGDLPGEVEEPAIALTMPTSPEEAIQAALTDNPAVVAATRAVELAEAALESARAADNPSASLQAGTGVGCANSFRSDMDCGERIALSAQVRAQLTVPLHPGGAQLASVRAAQHTVTQRLQELEAARRAASQSAAAAWESYQSAGAAIDAFRAVERSATEALSAVRQEADLGARTLLDVLNAEQDVIDARSSLIGARRDQLVAAFQLLAAMGRFTAAELALPVEPYDVEAYGQSVDAASFRLVPWVK